MAIKVTFIGAGSVGFTRTLMIDILTVPELQDTQFSFHDIHLRNLNMVAQLCQKDIQANGFPAKLTTTLDRRAAVADADYVINCTRIGGLEAYQTDIDIPLKYRIDQCVGDTLCAGGIMYGQRNIPQIQAFARDMKSVSKPDVLFMNYANPMAMNTWAALDAFDQGQGVNTVGLCHGVEGGWRQIDMALARLHGDKPIDWENTNHSHENQEQLHTRTEVSCAGINHQTWYVQIVYKGRVVDAAELLKAFETHPQLRRTEKVRIDVLRRFGFYSTESNGHLSEYLPWYRKRPHEIRRWIDLSCWINGETGGYLRVCKEGRNWFQSDFPRWLAEAGRPIEAKHRSSEHCSYIIEALETGNPYRGHFNVRNRGVITNLPTDCIVEVPGYVDSFGIHPTPIGDLPLACAATCRASIDVQRMSKEAAIHGDVALLKQAMLHDPLAICNPEEIWQLTDEMLVAQAKWLPQYQGNGSIRAAQRRLKNGHRVKTRAWRGAARQRIKSPGQLRKLRETSVLAADKAA